MPTESTAARHHLGAVARGSTATLAGALVSTVASFALALVVTRSTGQETAGEFFVATAIFVVALAAASLGTETGLARFVLRSETGPALHGLLRAAALPVLVVAVALAALLALWVPEARGLAWALPLAAVSDFCLAAVRAHARFRSTVLIDRVARPVLQIVVVAAALATGAGAAGLTAAWACAYVLTAGLALHALRGMLRAPGVTAHAAAASTERMQVDARSFWRFTWLRALARIAQVSIQKLDIVLVAALLGATDAAVYAVATRFVVFGQLANQAVSSVVQPRFTLILAGNDDPRLLSRVFGVTTGWSMLLAWPVYLCAAAAPMAYLGWFGAGYERAEAAAVVLVMVAGMLVAVATGPVDTLLLMAGRSGWSLANTLLAAVVNIGLCLLLVPWLGIVGAAVAWVVAVLLRCGLATVQLRADVRLAPDLRPLGLAAALPVLCLLLPVAALGRVVDLSPLGWLLACAVAAAAYAAVLWRLRVPLAIDVVLDSLLARRRVPAVAR
ncbi:lipopolysaccharide biosynthesis protein [Nocardioides sp. zg-536]|uniref:Lipopolysaccharide biosynthesis protein n=1 Tax=Nocardioides faecalis TaxID=2803858 RepID=A0A939BUJ4_9ACTN|nr:lipopolysaccharide biosynthesis protein [Nocardioides faecalis]MBM9458562.1 lipopolysaccharide biosynthesis protein [Nocardioides faecalis]QVI58564.1 lipopolysaccharide biosynthesis protein [Nocardioides faecalis]